MLASTAIIGQNFAAPDAAAAAVVATKTVTQGSSDTTTISAVEFTAKKSTSRASGTVTVAIVQGSTTLASSVVSTSVIKQAYNPVLVAFNAVKVTDDFQVVITYEGSGSVTVTTITIISQSTAPADSTAPSVAITNPAGGSSVSTGTRTVQGTASDNSGGSGVNTVQVRLDGGSYVTASPKAAGDWSTWSTSFNIATAGSHTIYAKVTDKAGNFKETSVTITATAPDTTAPAVAITNPAGGSTVPVSTITVQGTSSDNSGGSGINSVQVRLGSGSYKTATPKAAGDWSTWSTTLGVVSGQNTIYARATDKAGNYKEVSVTITASTSTVDTTAPSVAITQPAANSVVTVTGGSIVVTGTASDGGSGIKVVEVRVDSGSYVTASPKAAGDWSTWSVNLPITVGERRLVPRATDNAGNNAWNSIYVTITDTPSGGGDSGTLDKFGIEKVYPTVSGGNEWYVDMNDPASDPNFRNLPSMTKQPDGSWQVSASQVRMEAWSPSGEKWLNVEITGYAKMVGGSNELIQWYSRGGHHTSSNECLGSAYKGRLYGDGEARWVKEVTHPAYTSNKGSVQATSTPLMDRWVGFKAVIYNFVENGKTYVGMESYIDDDVTDSNGNLVIGNNWELASVTEDKGGWSTGNPDFNSSCAPSNKDSTQQYRQRDEILNLPGGTSTQNIAAWRSDSLTWNFKYLSVREIAAP
jgi:Big-like domain-containing protein/glucodextranase-like protein